MHKQSKAKPRKDNKKPHVEANVELSASVSELVYGLTSLIDSDDFASVYLRDSFLTKYADPSPESQNSRKSAAIAKWLDTDRINAQTNERLRTLDSGYNILPRVSFSKFLRVCRRMVSGILGPLTDEITVGAFSGGASTSRKRAKGHPGFKLSAKADVTEGLDPILDVMSRNIPFFQSYAIFSDLRIVEGAVLFTVPKKNDIDRCACKEPDINMFLQKGVGNHIRRKLKRHGVDLNDQSVNRNLARDGSIDAALATLDLSSASDTISIELVRLLLPDDWFLYLNEIRSRSVWVDGHLVETEMFSSMGNGFTFELESLLFYVIARTSLYCMGTPGRVSIYGDDIICPAEGSDDVIWALSVLGFTTNKDKSFTTGNFRESCGGHYLHGLDVSPFYLKRPATHLTDLIRVANQLRAWSTRVDIGRIAYPPSWCYPLWQWLKSEVPSEFWGGTDLNLDTQLVSPDMPKSTLLRVTTAKTVPQEGLYGHWQNSNWKRMEESQDESSEPEDTRKSCTKRRTSRRDIWGDKHKLILFREEWDSISAIPA